MDLKTFNIRFFSGHDKILSRGPLLESPNGMFKILNFIKG